MTAFEFAESEADFLEPTVLDFERPLLLFFERSLPDDDEDELWPRSLRERRLRDCESGPEDRLRSRELPLRDFSDFERLRLDRFEDRGLSAGRFLSVSWSFSEDIPYTRNVNRLLGNSGLRSSMS
ncbi:MAG: hypothetical protein AAF212_10690 [Verrucomicrobiota bacterium]